MIMMASSKSPESLSFFAALASQPPAEGVDAPSGKKDGKKRLSKKRRQKLKQKPKQAAAAAAGAEGGNGMSASSLNPGSVHVRGGKESLVHTACA